MHQGKDTSWENEHEHSLWNELRQASKWYDVVFSHAPFKLGELYAEKLGKRRAGTETATQTHIQSEPTCKLKARNPCATNLPSHLRICPRRALRDD